MQNTNFSTNSITTTEKYPQYDTLNTNIVKISNNESNRSSFVQKESVSINKNTPNGSSHDDNSDVEARESKISIKKSILKRRSFINDNKELRNDKFGNPIRIRGKNHRISFSQNLVQVTEVENWKQYNVDNGENEPGSGGCCSIF